MRTLIIIKPTGVKRGLVGEILKRFERVGFQIKQMKMMQLDEEKAHQLYEMHEGKEFFSKLIQHITSGPIIPAIVEIDLAGEEGIKLARKIVGKTNPLQAEMGSIRGDFAQNITQNIVHSPDSVENAEREIKIFFS